MPIHSNTCIISGYFLVTILFLITRLVSSFIHISLKKFNLHSRNWGSSVQTLDLVMYLRSVCFCSSRYIYWTQIPNWISCVKGNRRNFYYSFQPSDDTFPVISGFFHPLKDIPGVSQGFCKSVLKKFGSSSFCGLFILKLFSLTTLNSILWLLWE